MQAWFRSFRLSVCILASLLAVAGYRIAGRDISWLVVMTIFFIATTSMLQNDWRDRFQDTRKGKTLAALQEELFFRLLIVCWIVSVALVVLVAADNFRAGLVLMALAFVGAIYSETRRIPLVPIFLVSLVSATPALMPVTAGARFDRLWPLFFSSALIIFAREITKDIDDRDTDHDYKWTLPLALGNLASKFFVVITVMVSTVILAGLSDLILPGAFLALIGATLLACGVTPVRARNCIDGGIAFAVLALTVVG